MGLSLIERPRRTYGEVRRSIARRVAGLIVIIIVMRGGIWIAQERYVKGDRKGTLESIDIERIKQEVSRNSAILSGLREALTTKTERREALARPIQILQAVTTSLTSSVWITTISLKDSNLEVQGRALSEEEISEFLQKVRQIHAIHDASIAALRKAQQGDMHGYDFMISAKWKTPLAESVQMSISHKERS